MRFRVAADEFLELLGQSASAVIRIKEFGDLGCVEQTLKDTVDIAGIA